MEAVGAAARPPKYSKRVQLMFLSCYFAACILAGPELAASGRLMTLVKQAVSYQIESSRYRPRNTPKITTYRARRNEAWQGSDYR